MTHNKPSDMEKWKLPRHLLNRVPFRDAYILALCVDKKVLHIGASDWPYTKERYEQGDLLYAKIAKVATEQLGIDLNEEASAFLNGKQEITNSHIDVCDMNTIQNMAFFSPDIIILGETLEHIMNLEVALANLKKVMQKDTQLVVSVPNAFYVMNFLYALFKREHQHPDHNVAFTVRTLTQLLKKCDFAVTDFVFTSLEASRWKNLNWRGRVMYIIVHMGIRLSPLFSETLMLVAVKK